MVKSMTLLLRAGPNKLFAAVRCFNHLINNCVKAVISSKTPEKTSGELVSSAPSRASSSRGRPLTRCADEDDDDLSASFDKENAVRAKMKSLKSVVSWFKRTAQVGALLESLKGSMVR
jgi:hypothetical protein